MTLRCRFGAALFVCAAAALALFACAASASAQALKLTLDMAITLGLENSPDVKAKEFAVLSSQKDVKEARAAYYPEMSAGSNFSHSFTGAGQAGSSGTVASTQDQIGLSLDLSQTLYSFGRLNAAVAAAAQNVETAKLDLEEAKRSLAVEIQRGFYGYLLAREVLAVKTQALSYKEEALEVARIRYEAGLTTRREVLKAESDLKSFVPELIAARNDLETALLGLKDSVGIDVEVDVTIVGELDIPAVQLDGEKLVKKAVEGNSGVRRQKLKISLQKLQVNVQKTEKRPVISGFASAGLQNRFDLGAGGPGGLSGAAWDGTVSAGLSIQMGLSPHLPWSKETAGVEKSTAELQRLNADLQSFRNAAALEAGKVLLSLSESRAKIEAGEKARELAEELYLASKDMYENGLITSMEYGDAVMGLSDSHAGWLTYIYDYRMALCDLMDAVGAAIM